MFKFQASSLARKEITNMSKFGILPPELATMIFIYCLDAYPLPQISRAPLLLCRVCSSWRRLTLSTPQLWSHLRLQLRSDIHADILFNSTREWFTRAGSLPLSLFLQSSIYSRRRNTPISKEKNPANSPAIWARIENLEIVRQSLTESVSSLQYMVHVPDIAIKRLVFGRCRWSILEIHHLWDMPSLPCLRRLIFSNFNYDVPIQCPSFKNFRWTLLTHISTTGFILDVTSWRNIFRTCRSLQRGSFLLSGSSSLKIGVIKSLEITILPNLLYLRVIFERDGDWAILKPFQFPSLQTLCLGSLEGLSIWSSSVFSNIDTRRTLENLKLFKVRVSHQILAEFLHSTSKLRTLMLDVPLDYTPMLLHLSSSKDSGELEILPGLKKLTLYQWRRGQNDAVDICVQTFLTMVKRRWAPINPGERIAQISLYTSHKNPMAEKIPKFLTPLRKEGLVLRVGLSPSGYRVRQEVSW